MNRPRLRRANRMIAVTIALAPRYATVLRDVIKVSLNAYHFAWHGVGPWSSPEPPSEKWWR